MLTFLSAPSHWPGFGSQLSSPEAGTQLTAFSQISAHTSGAWRHSHILVTIPIWDFYIDIWEWHILPAHVWTPALMLHLTNPCAKRKVLSLTKPKGKIYKTKSLGHYITIKPSLLSLAMRKSRGRLVPLCWQCPHVVVANIFDSDKIVSEFKFNYKVCLLKVKCQNSSILNNSV